MKLNSVIRLAVVFPLLIIATALLGYCALTPSAPRPLTWVSISLEGILFILLWLGVVRPRRTVTRGLELLSSQETNNRLSPVGQPDADLIANLFNTLIERLHRERTRLREQESFLSQLISVSPMGVAIMDFDNRLTQVNPAFLKLIGVDARAEIEGRYLSDFSSPVAEKIAGMQDNEVLTIRNSHHNILRCTRLTFLDSGFRRPFILVENLTDEVLKAERATYGKVIRLMSHEVNNSMTGITTLLEILKTYHHEDSDLREFIESVSERCAAMSRFIASYAEVVRLPDPQLKTLNLGEFVNAQLPFLKSNSGFPIECSIADGDLYIRADADMLSQVLVNIIKNSVEAIIEAGYPDGRIDISISHLPRNRKMLTVTDNGCGISPATEAGLFNPFFSTKPDGQGIGLTMVAEILRRHNAEFSLNTSPEGLTHFRIIFP